MTSVIFELITTFFVAFSYAHEIALWRINKFSDPWILQDGFQNKACLSVCTYTYMCGWTWGSLAPEQQDGCYSYPMLKNLSIIYWCPMNTTIQDSDVWILHVGSRNKTVLFSTSAINIVIKFERFMDSILKFNIMCGIFRKIMIVALGTQRGTVETGLPSRAGFIFVRYSVTNNGTPFNNLLNFQSILVEG